MQCCVITTDIFFVAANKKIVPGSVPENIFLFSVLESKTSGLDFVTRFIYLFFWAGGGTR